MVKIIKVTSSTCGPCRMLKTVWDKVVPEFKNILFDEIVMDKDAQANEFAIKYNIRQVPTIVVLKDDVLKDVCVGALTKGALTTFIKKQESLID